MKRDFNSVYASHLNAFIDLKIKLGFKFETEAIVLSQIDTLAEKCNETSLGFTKEFSEKWCKRRLNESELYRYARIRMLATFSLYLRDIGIPSFVPRLPRYPKSQFIPHIYTDKEICTLFEACDNLKLENFTPNAMLISFPLLIRMLYATGVRIGEALALKVKDVNLVESFIRINDSKNGKERIIPISKSLVEACNVHIKKKSEISVQAANSNFFFSKLNGKRCSHSTIGSVFKRCLESAGIDYKGRMHGPRIHDLRHTFAVKSLAQMAEAGVDLYASLPILSCYLGHQSIESTNGYVRLTSQVYPDLLSNVEAITFDVFPKMEIDYDN
jgi:integrase/recombinase XerD